VSASPRRIGPRARVVNQASISGMLRSAYWASGLGSPEPEAPTPPNTNAARDHGNELESSLEMLDPPGVRACKMSERWRRRRSNRSPKQQTAHGRATVRGWIAIIDDLVGEAQAQR
jgi:hypothetical protein